MIGRIRGALLAGALALFGILVAAPAAKADFIYDLSVTGPDASYWTGSGSIAFSTLSGNTPAGVTAFAFHVSTRPGSPQDYVLADINSVVWSIDASMNLSLLLETSLIPFGPYQTRILLTNQPGAHGILCGSFNFNDPGSMSCLAEGNDGATLSYNSTLTASLVPIAVPEPATIALFGAGLVGLGIIARRRRAA